MFEPHADFRPVFAHIKGETDSNYKVWKGSPDLVTGFFCRLHNDIQNNKQTAL